MSKLMKNMQKRDWLFMLGSAAFVIVQVWLDLKLPDYMSRVTTLVQTEGGAMGEILAAGGMMLLCALGSLVAAVITGYFAASIAANLSSNIREKVFDKVQSFSMAEISRFSTASLITRSTNDITQVQMLVAMGLQMLIKAPVTAVWAIAKIAGKSWQWTTATAVSVAVLMVFLLLIVLVALPKNKRIQRLTDNLNSITRENLTGLRVVRAYNAEGYQQEKFDKANDELTHTNTFVMRMMALMMPAMTLISSGLSLSIYWIGAGLINSAGAASKIALFSDMVVFSSYAMQILMAFMMLTVVFIMLPRALVSAQRINEVLDTPLSVVEGGGAKAVTAQHGTVEFKNVSFQYPGAAEYVIRNVSFTAKPGETVAFIGSTGSGKSTLLNLIPRFYDATEGEVLVNGVNVKDYKKDELNNLLGYVPQKAVLFSGSVLDNIAYGDNGTATPPDVQRAKAAANVAQAQAFVENMDGGYNATITQGGTNVSGGQRQRLSIARAVYRKPDIYLFDDSFSALDYKTDRALRSALKQQANDSTNLIVAQRIGTILDADNIIVLDKGEVVGAGTHSELLKTCDVYQEIAQSQLSMEEIANG